MNHKYITNKTKLISLLGTFIVMLVFAGTSCLPQTVQPVKPLPPEVKTNTEVVANTNSDVTEPSVATETSRGFGEWIGSDVTVDPQIPEYDVKSDLSNVQQTEIMSFYSDATKQQLSENYFFITPSYNKEFFTIYEQNRYSFTPNFVTVDSVLHTYHLYFNYLLESVENEYLIDELTSLSRNMFDNSVEQYIFLEGTEWEIAALRNVGFFNVALKILDPESEVYPAVETVVAEELALMDEHADIVESPLWKSMGSDMKEDYSQYVPRGHYSKSDELKKYFKAMMWYGRLSFRVKSEDETRSALLITNMMNLDSLSNESWKKIYEPTNFFVGASDDLGYFEYNDLITEIYGDKVALAKITNDELFADFYAQAKELEGPKINSMPVMATTAGGSEDLEEEIKAFRFMGQRYTIDADVFGNLICRKVGNKDGTMPCPNLASESRMLPMALDIPAAMGSETAYAILNDLGETEYAQYSENMLTMQDYISDLDKDTWTQNLYWGWMYTLKPLTEEKVAGYPSFITTDEWARKQLLTYIGSWTELKHDTILYAKQVYAEMGAGMPDETDDRGYVEPEPELYARMTALIGLTRDGLKTRGLLASDDEDNLDKLEILVSSLQTIAEKELADELLTDDEYDLIRTYGGSLEHFWLETMSEEEKGEKSQTDLLNDNPAPLVTDVATDPNGSVLEEATGYVNDIYVIVPVDGGLRVASGGVYSHYEFTQPLADRLTDEAWRERLETGEDVPETASWQQGMLLDSIYE
ncbi:MAG: DUF3160 domain-containing protein [bacterium]|nr:DUF3160 domain-containing protein [bacterium]